MAYGEYIRPGRIGQAEPVAPNQKQVHSAHTQEHTNQVAENGLQAVSLYEKHGKDVDLVIMDVVVSEMGGKEGFQHIISST